MRLRLLIAGDSGKPAHTPRLSLSHPPPVPSAPTVDVPPLLSHTLALTHHVLNVFVCAGCACVCVCVSVVPLPGQGVRVVPEQSAWVVERFGKFHSILSPGLHFLIPIVDRIAYVHSLKETAVNVPNQTAITRDNVTIQIDGVLFLKIEDPAQASYGVRAPFPPYCLEWLALMGPWVSIAMAVPVPGARCRPALGSCSDRATKGG